MLIYNVNYTEDGGKTWETSDTPLTVLNGTTSRFSVEDGRIVMITHADAAEDDDPPVVSIITCSEDFHLSVDEDSTWFDNVPFDKTQPFTAEAEYLGDYKLKLTVKTSDPEAETVKELYSGEVNLEPVTLAPLPAAEAQ